MNNSVGLKWYKCDFHLHTNASPCFQDSEKDLEKWMEEVENKKLDCIAVTDHNTGKNIDIIKNIAKQKGITVFPGVEITCGDAKVHLLVIFDVDRGTQHIEDFLIKCKINRDEFGVENAYSNCTLMELLEIAKGDGGIVIPSHVDDYSSLSQAGYIMAKNFMENPDVLGIQVVDSEFINKDINKKEVLEVIKEKRGNINIEESHIKDFHNTTQLGVDSKCAILTFSDNPLKDKDSKHGLYGIGSRYTWIKMSQNPNLESLRQALLMNKVRIKNDFESKSIPYIEPNLWIKSISIKDTVVTNNLKVQFNPQMNTIIGGRGSGKSSILKFILGCLYKNEELEKVKNISDNFDEFFNITKNAEYEFTGVLTTDTEIEIELNRDGIEYKIKCYNFEKNNRSVQYKTDIYSNGEEKKLDVDSKEFIKMISSNIEIYLQKHVYEISKNTSALREKIDIRIKNELDNINSDIESIKKNYISKKLEISNKKNILMNKNKWIAELKDIDIKLDILNKNGLNELSKEINKFKNEEKQIDAVKKRLMNTLSDIREIESKINLLSPKNEEFESEELKNIINMTVENKNSIIEKIGNCIDEYDTLLSEFTKNVNNTKWYSDYSNLQSEFIKKVEELTLKGIDISRYREYTEEKDKLQAKIEESKEIDSEIIELQKDVDEIFKSYIEHKKKVTKLRNSFIKQSLEKSGLNIEIKFNQFRDKIHFIKTFRKIIQKTDNFKDDIDNIETYLFEDGYILNNLNNLKNLIHSIREDKEVNEIKLSNKFKNIIKNLNEEQVTDIDLLIPEDTTDVKYKSSSSGSFVSLKTASAGQRTSSILSYILSSGTGPLILDQPEDDLDNKLIYELIVDGIVKSKENRQIIVVSHNANIPVNGDSDYVISLDYKENGVEVHSSGSVEDKDVKKDIFDIMEGGETAFEIRSKRYGF